jgi:hypothetical protein
MIDYHIYSGRLGFLDPGSTCRLIFTPSAESASGRPQVAVYSQLGSGSPEALWYGRATSFGRVRGTDGQQIERLLRENEASLMALDGLYLGSEIDAHGNRRGNWADDVSDLLDALSALLDGAATYWDAEDFLGADAVYDLAIALTRGETIEEYASGICSEAGANGVLLDRDDVARRLADRAAGLVYIETMPDQYRASHRAAGNFGEYPSNGAERAWMDRETAEGLVDADPDGYARIVREGYSE